MFDGENSFLSELRKTKGRTRAFNKSNMWRTIVWSCLVMILACHGVHSLSCLMCNSLMKGKWEACPDQHQYHAMVCRSSTHTCLKIDGNQTVVNNTAEGNKITSTIGIQRNCGTPYNMKLLDIHEPVVTGCKNVDIKAAPLTARPNADGSLPQYYFKGEVCVCNSDNCNGG